MKAEGGEGDSSDDDGSEDVVTIAHRLARIEARSWLPADQEDLAQEVLVKYSKEFGPDGSADEPQAWLRVVTRTTAVDMIRARKELVLLPPVEESGELLLDVLHLNAVGPSFHVVTQDFLSKVLDRLGPTEAQLIQWKYIDGQSAEWIGERTGRTEAAARKAVNRALSALREVVDSDSKLQEELRSAMSRWYPA